MDAQQVEAFISNFSPIQPTLGTRIKLDVGGTIFATSLETLKSVNGSFFWLMFGKWNSKPVSLLSVLPLFTISFSNFLKEPDGTYFIDRDPLVFRHILNWLRTRELNFSFLTEVCFS